MYSLGHRSVYAYVDQRGPYSTVSGFWSQALCVCFLFLTLLSIQRCLREPLLRARDLSQDLFHNPMTGPGRGANVQLLLGHALGRLVVVIMALMLYCLVDD